MVLRSRKRRFAPDLLLLLGVVRVRRGEGLDDCGKGILCVRLALPHFDVPGGFGDGCGGEGEAVEAEGEFLVGAVIVGGGGRGRGERGGRRGERREGALGTAGGGPWCTC